MDNKEKEMKISAHCLVKNEARFLWYAVMSVIDYVDEIKIWDTGSTDETLDIIGEIKKIDQEKVVFKKVENKNFSEEKMRQEMINQDLSADWILILDGDEIWWDESIKKVVGRIKKDGNYLESVVVPTFNLIEDMFHYQEKEAGRYHLAGHTGHYTIRAFNRRIPGLHAAGEHGIFSWRDEKNKKIEARSPSKIFFIDAPYIHTTHLRRAGSIASENNVFKRAFKYKYELGISFPKDFYYPEIFFRPRPEIISSPWKTASLDYKFRAFIETPFKKIRRRYFMNMVKPGY